MRQTLIVAHVVERLQCGNAGFQDARGHFGLNMLAVAQALYILAEKAVQRLVAGYGEAVLSAQRSHVLDDKSVQSVEG